MLTVEQFQEAIRKQNNFFFLRKPAATVGPLMVMVGREREISQLGQPFLMQARCNLDAVNLLLEALTIMIQADHQDEVRVLARIIFGDFVPISPVPDKELAAWTALRIPNSELVHVEWQLWAHSINPNFSGQVFKTFIDLQKC